MRLHGPACRLTVFVGESHQWRHRPVYAEIVHRAHRAGLAGASVFRGVEGFGASSRSLPDRFVQSRVDSVFPWGTLAVNVAGALVLGAVVRASTVLHPDLAVFLGAGCCGALTTFSSFGFETMRLLEEGSVLDA